MRNQLSSANCRRAAAASASNRAFSPLCETTMAALIAWRQAKRPIVTHRVTPSFCEKSIAHSMRASITIDTINPFPGPFRETPPAGAGGIPTTHDPSNGDEKPGKCGGGSYAAGGWVGCGERIGGRNNSFIGIRSIPPADRSLPAQRLNPNPLTQRARHGVCHSGGGMMARRNGLGRSLRGMILFIVSQDQSIPAPVS